MSFIDLRISGRLELPKILTDIEKFGVEQFRTHKSAAFFYVPRYASNTLQKYGNLITPILPFSPKKKTNQITKAINTLR